MKNESRRINFPRPLLVLLSVIVLAVVIILLPGAILKASAAGQQKSSKPQPREPVLPASSSAKAKPQKGGGAQATDSGKQEISKATATVAASATVNVAQLPASTPKAPGEAKEQMENEPFIPAPFRQPLPSDVPAPGANPAKEPPPALPVPKLPSPAPIASFQALDDGLTLIPPDTTGAVGPNHVMTTLNDRMRVQNRTGGIISTFTTASFWAPLSITSLSDPRILYDSFNGRWMQTIIVDIQLATASICVAVSQTNNPTGVWNLFKIDVDPANTTWADFPSIDFNKDWIVVSVNMFTNSTNSFVQVDNLVCVKSNLYANITPVGTFKFFNFGGFGSTFSPAVTYDNTTTTEYFLQIGNGNFMGSGFMFVYALTGPVGSEAVTPGATISTPNPWDSFHAITLGGFVPQNPAPAGSANRIMNNDSRTQNVVYRNGNLWTAHNVFLPAGGSPTRCAVQWWEVTPAGAILQRARIEDPAANVNSIPSGRLFAFPSITVNSFEDVVIGYSEYGSDIYAQASYSTRRAADPVNTLRDNTVLKVGEGRYNKTGNGLTRWGDYSNTVVDPVNDFDMWTIQEYADSRINGDATSRWATWWGRISFVPTEAEFASFSVKGFDGGQYLDWKTAREVDNLGFNIYRDDRGKRTRLNSELLAGSALVAGQGTVLGAGKTYAWWDRVAASADTRYLLEEVDLNGQSVWHGPVAVEKVGGSPPVYSQAAALSDVGNPVGQLGVTRPVERRATTVSALPGQVPAQNGLASQPAVKLSVNREGLCRVTQSELVAAGLDPNVDPHLLQLFVDGTQQPMIVTGEADGRFGSTDAVEFYGVGMDTPSTGTRVYWLVAGTKPGLRIQQVPAPGRADANGSFPYTVERKDRVIYFSALRNGEKENFFGPVIGTNAVNQDLTLQHVAAQAAAARLEVALQGVTGGPHTVRVQLNGAVVGEVSFVGQADGMASITVPQSTLTEGQNVVRLMALGGQSDISLVNYVRVTYQHTYAADNGALRLSAMGGSVLGIDGFGSAGIRVLDVTDPNGAQELLGTIVPGKSGYGVALTAQGTGQRTLLAFSSDQIRPPAAVAANQPSNWRQPSQGADLLVVTHRDFASSIGPLKTLRQSQGLSVAVVGIEDVYDEFSFGQKTPQALKDFMTYAATTWKKKPRFGLFVGDASFDPRNYLGMANGDFVPTKLIDTGFMETASDDWFVDRDGVPELAMGRLPVRTPQEANAMVAKIVGYDSSKRAEAMLLVADSNDGFDFEAANAQLRLLAPRDVRLYEVKRGQLGDAETKRQVLSGLSQGQRVVNYSGHGNVNQWRADILTSVDAASLENNYLPLFVMMTCLNGYFQDAALDSIGEALMKNVKGGAVAVWASSGLSEPGGQALVNQELYRLLFNSQDNMSLTVGEATARAKSAIGDPDIRRTWILFGDPAMKLK